MRQVYAEGTSLVIIGAVSSGGEVSRRFGHSFLSGCSLVAAPLCSVVYTHFVIACRVCMQIFGKHVVASTGWRLRNLQFVNSGTGAMLSSFR